MTGFRFYLSLYTLSGFIAVALTTSPRSGYIAENHPDPVSELAQRIIRNKDNLNFTGGKLQACWKDSFGRGVGKPIHTCKPGMEEDALLCYVPCREGYEGVGPVCWEECKAGFTDHGATCGKSGEIISADNDDCPWYDICGLTLEKGCSKCPEGYKNDGCTCRIDPETYGKDSYGRGVGVPLGCAEDEEYDAGLCYDPCPRGYDGVGPVCWQECPRQRPEDYGAVCCSTPEACNDFIKEVSIATITAIAAAIEQAILQSDASDFIKEIIETVGAFMLFSCERFTLTG